MNTKPQHIAVSRQQDVLVIEPLLQYLNDFEKVAALRDEIVAAMERADAKNVVLDLRNIKVLTSVALFPFIEVRSVSEQLGGHVVLCNVDTAVAQALTVSQLLVETREHAHYLVLAEDVPSAITWFKRATPQIPVHQTAVMSSK